MLRLILLIQFIVITNAFGHTLEVTPKFSFKLDRKQWDFGRGSLIEGTAPLNLYSHKKIKEQQIVYEDLYLVKDTLVSRLPRECQNQIGANDLTEGSLCRFMKAEKGSNKQSLTVLSLFNTDKKNVLRVRSIYVIGPKSEISRFDQDLTRHLKTASAKGSQK